MKRKLELNALSGFAKCFLEIELFGNGDMTVGMLGQDDTGEFYYISAQIPNPVTGGGDPDNYKILSDIYDILGNKK